MKFLHHCKMYDDTKVHISIEYNCSMNVMDKILDLFVGFWGAVYLHGQYWMGSRNNGIIHL